MLSTRDRFEIVFSDGTAIKTEAVLMSSRVRRRQIVAPRGCFVVLDVAAGSPEYEACLSALGGEDMVALPAEPFAPHLGELEEAMAHAVPAAAATSLRLRLVEAATARSVVPRAYDRRIATVLELIQRRSHHDISLGSLARAVRLSPDRLRHLFRAEIGCSISHYAQTAAVLKSFADWATGETLTSIAHGAGFHDHAHYSHTFREMFGFAPMAFSAMRRDRFIDCEKPVPPTGATGTTGATGMTGATGATGSPGNGARPEAGGPRSSPHHGGDRRT